MTTTSFGIRIAAIVARVVLLTVIAGSTGVLLGALFLPAALATNDVLGVVRSDIFDVPPLGEADTPPQNSYVYAADGSELAELTFEENRVPIELADVPQVAIDAILATEDASFYEHEGVNHAAIVRAAVANIRAGGIESGASTITQQYVKLTFLSPEQTMARKIEEALYAIQIEDELTKDQILELYLNRSYFGSGVYGIGTAAERYFSKGLDELSLGEAAMLAGLLRAPEANNPINSMQNAHDRRDVVLRQMATHGFITRGQAQAAIDESLEVSISEPPAPENPFWVDWVSRLLVNEQLATSLGTQVDALEQMGVTADERRRVVFQGGLRIHTTLDPELQALAEDAIRNHLTYENEPPESIATEPMGSIVSIQPDTGAILAMAIGPRSYGSCVEDDSWVGEADSGELLCDRTKVNPAVPGVGGSGRQPGSSFKPFLDAAALEEGVSPGLTLDARGPKDIEGCPTNNGKPWTVNNSGGDGILDMYEAVQRSSNVYHALLIAEVGADRAADMFERLSGYPVPERDIYCPLALGATDVTPLAMASGYAALANRGVHCAPFPITRIDDAAGRTIWEHSPDCERVVDTEVADRIVDIMAGPVRSGGTAPIANLGEWPTRGKTGTTNDYVDAWFAGYVKQLATVAWVGYPNGTRFFSDEEAAAEACGEEAFVNQCPPNRKTLENVTIAGEPYGRVFGGTIPAPMWKRYMEQAVQRFDPEGFPNPGPIPVGRVPNLLQAGSISQAEKLAEEAGFSLVVSETTHYRPAGSFLSQTPGAGSEAALGSRISLEISDGKGEVPKLPDVTGKEYDEAAEILFELGYEVKTKDVEVDDEELVGKVVTMDPAAGEELIPGNGSVVVLGVGVLPKDDKDEDDKKKEDDDGGGRGGGQGGGGGGNPPDGDQ